MRKQLFALALTVIMALGTFAAPAFADIAPITTANHFWLNTVNDAQYGTTGNQWGTPTTPDAYWFKFDGGGLNQLRFTTDNTKASEFGQVTSLTTASSSGSGSFYLSTTGGRGYNDDVILAVSVQASDLSKISNDFSLNITSSGYTWTPQSTQIVGPDSHFVTNAINETVDKSDFQYGPQTLRPGTGSLVLPFYSGQNTSDPSTSAYMMFIDLHLGNFTNNSSYTNGGEIQVDYSFSGLYDTVLAFNAYAYTLTSNTGMDSINWTNNLSTDINAFNQTGYSITSTAAAPVPIPAAFWLLGSGFSGMFFMRRKKALA
ncbi:MAG: hypothetical protein VB050_00880 [Geobacteraceae bacterium]|nr:hypothetical protein [Geobacteraceae bacterium]